MKTIDYVDAVHRTVTEVKDARSLGITNTTWESNLHFTARTNVIYELAIKDPEISSEDFVLIRDAVSKAREDLHSLIYER